MSVSAILKTGGTVQLAAKHGATIEDVVASLTSGSLTGSAVPLADATVELDDGRTIPYTDIEQLVSTRSF